jgi:hypothetical protein
VNKIFLLRKKVLNFDDRRGEDLEDASWAEVSGTPLAGTVGTRVMTLDQHKIVNAVVVSRDGTIDALQGVSLRAIYRFKRATAKGK